ncbi:hypothetical protein Hypma_015289 [Hypsizygus marmoreus]|uniref:Uncharacterized protein n=1 Tax=Hypsizygus marmoreus TaxID=39966 RepID=A0A369K9P7_HYPMA|nr:hypothetical protein Hypma_015289 [Hypsizygus marmoreus]
MGELSIAQEDVDFGVTSNRAAARGQETCYSPKRHSTLELTHPPRFWLGEIEASGGVFSGQCLPCDTEAVFLSLRNTCGPRVFKSITSKQGSRELKTPLISEMFGSLGMDRRLRTPFSWSLFGHSPDSGSMKKPQHHFPARYVQQLLASRRLPTAFLQSHSFHAPYYY